MDVLDVSITVIKLKIEMNIDRKVSRAKRTLRFDEIYVTVRVPVLARVAHRTDETPETRFRDAIGGGSARRRVPRRGPGHEQGGGQTRGRFFLSHLQ
jgi:hypothetical protein